MNRNLGKKIVSVALLGSMCAYTMPVFANTKEETVYSKLDTSGNEYSTIVSEKLSNDGSSELINDISELMNIKNTNGDETFDQDGNKLVWKANGNSIQYQGDTEKELPIRTTVKYELNGEEIDAKDIVGKEGKVKVTVSYENLDAHSVKVNGKWVRMYTPFVVVAGTLLDNENNTNIKVTNGKLLDNGTRTIAVGFCVPGMQESLDLSKKDIELPESFSIEMDTKSFEMNNIISYATAKVLDEADLDIFDNLDEIYAKANELQDASNQLVNGANTLNNGAEDLRNGASELNNGAKTLNEGASKVNEGANTLASGTTTLANGTKSLKAGATTLKNGVTSLDTGAQTLSKSTTGLGTKMGALEDGISSANNGSKQLKDGVQAVSAGVTKLYDATKDLSTDSTEQINQ